MRVDMYGLSGNNANPDGDNGYMTREEMLTHVVTHGGYHRGEVGRILVQVSNGSEQGIKLPWDTYAVHLHTTEPSRRLRGREPFSEAVDIGQ